ncbi:Thymidylate kinase [Halapricum desulfuricans]|uniref:Thymidylate kinase n=1 Tax=Halapricum desulfuricans TaxID=2841257 RepID=A0A897NHP0_9EURY|nr:Thymidylate kinase [Halapricum desulfuricans]
MLITLERIDGSGKTSAWEALRRAEFGVETFTLEPTDSWYGDAVARSIGVMSSKPSVNDSDWLCMFHTVGCNKLKEFATPGGEYLYGHTANSISRDTV